MPFQLTVLYPTPEDIDTFDRHYREFHIPRVMNIPGLQGFTVQRPGPTPAGLPPAFHLLATLTFASEEAMNDALATPEGMAARKDADTFAPGNVIRLSGPTSMFVEISPNSLIGPITLVL